MLGEEIFILKGFFKGIFIGFLKRRIFLVVLKWDMVYIEF